MIFLNLFCLYIDVDYTILYLGLLSHIFIIYVLIIDFVWLGATLYIIILWNSVVNCINVDYFAKWGSFMFFIYFMILKCLFCWYLILVHLVVCIILL